MFFTAIMKPEMDAKEFIKKKVDEEGTGGQTRVARKIGVSIGTINNILYSSTELRLDTISKIAKAYGLPVSTFVEEAGAEWVAPTNGMTEKERRLLNLFRQLDERRQDRAIEMIEDMALALRESFDRGTKDGDCEASNSGRK